MPIFTTQSKQQVGLVKGLFYFPACAQGVSQQSRKFIILKNLVNLPQDEHYTWQNKDDADLNSCTRVTVVTAATFHVTSDVRGPRVLYILAC